MQGMFARMKVSLDISKPLKQGVWVKSDNALEDICILLLYARLPNFCYMCGKIGHLQRDCHIQVSTDNQSPFATGCERYQGQEIGKGCLVLIMGQIQGQNLFPLVETNEKEGGLMEVMADGELEILVSEDAEVVREVLDKESDSLVQDIILLNSEEEEMEKIC